jgi:putative flippase GtrA
MQRLIALSPQFMIYVAGGALSALVDIGLLELMLLKGAGAFWATTLGFLAGLIVNYAFHARVTFKNVITPSTLMRFLLVTGLNYVLTLGCVALAVAVCNWALLGKLASLPLVALNGFYLSKYWIFK